MNTPITLSECALTSLANTFTDEESFSAFGKNKLSKLYNLYAVTLGEKNGYGNLKASCKFQPHRFLPEQIDLLEGVLCINAKIFGYCPIGLYNKGL